PVHGKGLPQAARGIIAHRPNIVRGNRRDALQLVVGRVYVGTVDYAPLTAVPVLGERPVVRAADVPTHGPHVVGRDGGHRVEPVIGVAPAGVVGVGQAPLRAVPMDAQRA